MKNELVGVINVLQEDDRDCGMCTVTAVLNYLGNNCSLEDLKTRTPLNKYENGMLVFDQAYVAASQGYKTQVYTGSLELADITWNKLTTKSLIARLKTRLSSTKNPIRYAEDLRHMLSWLQVNKKAKLSVTNDIPAAIKKAIIQGSPVIVAVSHNLLHKIGKIYRGKFNDLKGTEILHSVIVVGYDDKSVIVLDPLVKQPYEVTWDVLMTVMPSRKEVLVIG